MGALSKVALIRAWRARSIFRQQAEQVPVLFYHQVCDGGQISRNQRSCVSPKQFEQQMRFLRANGYVTLTLAECVSWLEGRRKVPVKSLCVTFDDGHRDNYYNAYPILRKYGITATIFICNEQIGKELWYSRKLRKWERAYDEDDDLYFEFLTWRQIQEMDAAGISFQSHTCSHPFLTELTASDLAKELWESKRVLERTLGKPVDFVSYPYGDYNSETKKAVARAGYRAAFGTGGGLLSRGDDRFALNRTWLSPEDSMLVFQLRIYGIEGVYSRLVARLMHEGRRYHRNYLAK